MGESPLDDLTVLKNCPQSWSGMTGDNTVRHCPKCKLNVYNLSMMRRDEATRLVQANEGRLCVRFYRRPDGKILTKDCSKFVKAHTRIRVSVATVLATVFAAVGFPLAMPV